MLWAPAASRRDTGPDHTKGFARSAAKLAADQAQEAVARPLSTGLTPGCGSKLS